MLQQLTDLKFRKTKMSVRYLRLNFNNCVEALSGPNQASKIDLFTMIIKFFKLTLLTIFAKSSIADV